MKKIIAIIATMCLSVAAFAQAGGSGAAAAPSIMVVPSDDWLQTHGFMEEVEFNGVTQFVPQYREALVKYPELKNVAISTVNRLMAKNNFRCKDLEATLKGIDAENARNSLTMNKSTGSGIAESPREQLARVASADIIMEVSWTVYETGPRKSIAWTIRALDSYTFKEVASAGSTTAQTVGIELSVMLEESIAANMAEFLDLLFEFFDQLTTYGREIALEFRIWDDAGYDFESDFADDELGFYITEWVLHNAIGGTMVPSLETENIIQYESVRVPNVDENGYQLTPSKWLRKLTRVLKKDPMVGGVTEERRGLGNVVIILGAK